MKNMNYLAAFHIACSIYIKGSTVALATFHAKWPSKLHNTYTKTDLVLRGGLLPMLYSKSI